MRELTPSSNIPLSITLAADSRLSATNYFDDQIWELQFNRGEPPGLTLETTYGLRVSNMRIFPRYIEGHTSISDPREFAKTPRVNRHYPNYINVSYEPFEGIDVKSEYWAQESNLVAGRIKLTNTSPHNRQFRFEWVAILTPIEGDQRITPQEVNGTHTLIGVCEDISPAIFISGGATSTASPYPALVFKLDLPPGKNRQFIWGQAALASADESITLAHEATTRNWDAEIARIELINSSNVEIFTGNSDWDSAFSLAQTSALGLIMGPNHNLPFKSFIKTRRPDLGYSRTGLGQDFGNLWSGQTPLDAYYLANIILPSEPRIAEGILLNFLSAETEAGEIDLKPGLGGQLSNRLASPILASLALRIYRINENKEFLQTVFSPLYEFFQSWFTSEHDRDEDGIPEWDHPLQTGFEENPLFARWRSSAQAIDITKSESPSLCSFLYQECQVLIHIAKLINQPKYLEYLNSRARNLHKVVEDSWNEHIQSYLNWDRDTHHSPSQVTLGEMEGPGVIVINQEFDIPLRPVIRIKTKQETTRKSQINIHGLSVSGKHRVENITGDRILWFPGLGTATSEQVYASIEFVEILGINHSDYVNVSSAGYSNEDLSSLLPIWAQIPSKERARSIIEQTLLNPERYWRKYGFPTCPDLISHADQISCTSINIPLCCYIGEGLIKYGYRDEAAELLSRMMEAITINLKKEGYFREYYDAETGQGSGEINELNGLPPIGFFLDTLGIRIISPWRIGLSGYNPYPWPVTVKYRGTTILRGKEKTQIVFPDGQNTTINDPTAQIITVLKNGQ